MTESTDRQGGDAPRVGAPHGTGEAASGDRFRRLPDPVRLVDTSESCPASPPGDPDGGRNRIQDEATGVGG